MEMVGRDDLSSAVGMGAALFNASRIIGPAVAGLVIGVAGVSAAFFLNALSFGGVLGALLLMDPARLLPPPPFARPGSAGEVSSRLGEGVSYVRRTPIAAMAVLVLGCSATFAMNFNVLVPPFARDVLGTGAEGFGFLMAASGTGSLIAALWLAFGRGARPTVVAGGAILLGVSVVALSVTRAYPAAAVLMFAAGFGGIAMGVSANMTLQLAVPDELRGRVMSVYTTIFAGTSPIGGLMAGSIASAAGVSAAFLVGGIGATVTGLLAMAWLVRYRRRRAAIRATARSNVRPTPKPTAAQPLATQPVAAPNTSAAFSPPKPNDVESTRS
jgi:predicted MFS family arabinose efflux permease